MKVGTCRFIKEFGNFQKEYAKCYSDEYKRVCEEVDKILSLTRKGYVTVHEAMKMLNDIDFGETVIKL